MTAAYANSPRPLGSKGPSRPGGDEQADSDPEGSAKLDTRIRHEHYPFWQTVRAQDGRREGGEVRAPGSLRRELPRSRQAKEPGMDRRPVLKFPDCEACKQRARSRASAERRRWFKQVSKMMVSVAGAVIPGRLIQRGTLRARGRVESDSRPREGRRPELFRPRERPENRDTAGTNRTDELRPRSSAFMLRAAHSTSRTLRLQCPARLATGPHHDRIQTRLSGQSRRRAQHTVLTLALRYMTRRDSRSRWLRHDAVAGWNIRSEGRLAQKKGELRAGHLACGGRTICPKRSRTMSA